MNEDQELRAAYAPRLREPGPHRPDCPSPDALLAAIQGEGPEAERIAVLDRALGCPECRRELALLEAVSGPSDDLAARRPRPNAWRRFGPLALAATLLVAVGIFGLDRLGSPEPTRGGGAGEISLVAPAAGAGVGRGPARFVWRAVPGGFRYTLEVVDAGGLVRFTATTADTTLTARLDSLLPGEHRWSVRGRLGDGSDRRSEARVLRVR